MSSSISYRGIGLYTLSVEKGKLFIVLGERSALSEEDRKDLRLLGLKAWPKEKVPLIGGRAWDLLQELSRCKKIKSQNHTLLVEPFTKLELLIEIEEVHKGQFLPRGFLCSQGTKDPIEKALAIFPTVPPSVQRGPLLQQLSKNISFEWFEKIYPRGKVIDQKTLETWIEESHADKDETPTLHAPHIEKKSVIPHPLLQLTDRFGAFASLFFLYGTEKKIAYEDESLFRGRNLEEEKSFEKDLLETGFLLKVMEGSRYYCPMDLVFKSLRFLLEIGWKVVDYKGKEVICQGKSDFILEEGGENFILRGEITFGNYRPKVEEIVGAFNRRERFVQLSSQSVGLIDPLSLPESIEEFSLREGVFKAPKERLGTLQGLLPQGDLKTLLLLAKEEGGNEGEIELGKEFCGELHPYQKEGVRWLSLLQKNRLAGLLADEMGLGKTVQTLAFISTYTPQTPILVVAPTSLLFNWQREWNTFLPTRSLHLYSGPLRKEGRERALKASAILTSYALLRQDRDFFTSYSYAAIILDEAQVIKNYESQVAEVVYALQGEFRLAITGTPLENRAEDLWSIFHFLLPGLFGELADFRSKMLSAEVDRRYLDQYKKRLQPFILRRKKEVIASELPDKVEQIIWVEMGEKQRSFYESLLAESQKLLATDTPPKKIEIFEKILRLRQICVHPHLAGASFGKEATESAKMERLLQDLEEALLEGAKVLIYSQFTSALALIRLEIAARGWSFVYLDGQSKNREEIVRRFQEDEQVPIFLLSLKAGGVGLNLTRADYVFILDPWWNHAVEAQAIDRAHRLGRKKLVIARRYITALSIEEKMMTLKERKKQLATGFLDQLEEMEGYSMDELLSLLT